MDFLERLDQSLVAGFFVDDRSKQPRGGLRVYAELHVLGAPKQPTAPRIDGQLAPSDVLLDAAIRNNVERQLLAWYDGVTWAHLATDEQRDLLKALAEKCTRIEGFFGATDEVQGAMIREALNDLLGETPAKPSVVYDVVRAIPMGVLATDHAGYVSFDCSRLRGQIKTDERVLPVLYAGSPAIELPLLPQARISDDVILGWFQVGGEQDGSPLAQLPSMQSPSLLDWTLSPGSFALPAQGLLGDDGCERLYPSDVATHDFLLRQVVRLSDSEAVPVGFRAGWVDDYEVTWFPLGHSLGSILHSMGLAPGESVKLAVIDWSWASSQARSEDTAMTEELQYELHRDRLITESMKAGLDEWQRGGSVMGGGAGSAGISGGFGLVDFAAGGTYSMGGSYSTSKGSRDLAADTAQRVTDQIGQATSSLRDLKSTVVVQARQEEKESIQTRTFTNHNHAHTLTILHYEILQHFRVVTRWVRRRPAVLVDRAAPVWTHTFVTQNRTALEAGCFDLYAKAGFDALERAMVQWSDDAVNPKPMPPAVAQERDFDFTTFELHLQVGDGSGATPNGVGARVILTDGAAVELQLNGDSNLNHAMAFNSGGEKTLPVQPRSPVAWGHVARIEIKLNGTNGMILERQGVDAKGSFGTRTLKPEIAPRLIYEDHETFSLGDLARPGPDVPATPAPKTGRQRLAPEDNKSIDRLMEHLTFHSDYYARVLNLSRHRDSMAKELAGEDWDGVTKVLDHVDPTPLETFAGSIAFALTDVPDQIAKEAHPSFKPQERLVTLPTRGVFVEGKLGHCSVAEEIDNTRFWKWEEHPLQVDAPDIAAIQAITPTPQAVQVTPTALPAPVATITSPPDAPAPTGLAAAFQLLGTANIFRDMSGRAELADLLKKLSDNSISIAEAANKAKEIRDKYGAELDKNQTDLQGKMVDAGAAVLAKSIEAEQAASTRKAEAEASKSATDASRQRIEAAKDIPPALRQPIYKAAADQLSGSATLRKGVLFQAFAYNGEGLDGPFELVIRDVAAGTSVLEEVSAPSTYNRVVDFPTAAPMITAVVSRLGTPKIKVGDVVFEIKPIKAVGAGKIHAVGAAHTAITIRLEQQSMLAEFEATSTDTAVDTLALKLGGEISGPIRAFAVKLIGAYETENAITHVAGQKTAYKINAPSGAYALTIDSQ